MNKKLVVTVLLGSVGMFSQVAMAQEGIQDSRHSLSANVGLYSQYMWRGMTQTKKKPALQGGVDYAHDSGLYAGVWASNVGWPKDGGQSSLYKSGGTFELDLYGGYGGELGGTGIGYDLGMIQYVFPGSRRSGNPAANATEAYVGINYSWFSAKYSHVISSDAWGFDDARGTGYYELNADIPIGESGFELNLHFGSFKYDGKSGGVRNKEYDYEDWKVGLTRSWSNGYVVGGYWTDNSADTDDGWDRKMTESQFTVYVQKSF
jgi:uncharacterized protein (TIGR02001 family)